MRKVVRLGILLLLILMLLPSCAPGAAQEEGWPSRFSVFPAFESEADCEVTIEDDVMTRTYQGLEFQAVQEYFDMLAAQYGFIVTGKNALKGDADQKSTYSLQYYARSKSEQIFTYTIGSFANQTGIPSIWIPLYEGTIATRDADGNSVIIHTDIGSHAVATMSEDGLVYEYVEVRKFELPYPDFEKVIWDRYRTFECQYDANTVYIRHPLDNVLTFEQAKTMFEDKYKDRPIEIIYDFERTDPFFDPK